MWIIIFFLYFLSFYVISGTWLHNIWYQNSFLGTGFFQTNNLGLFPTFFYKVLDRENQNPSRKTTEIYVFQFLDLETLHVWRYFPWKLGFFTSPKTSLKQVLWEKQPYMWNTRSKLSENYCIRKKMDHNICGSFFSFRSKTWHVAYCTSSIF